MDQPRSHFYADYEEYDSIQLLSISDLVEVYYTMLRNAMEAAASEKPREKSSFNGELVEEDAQNLSEFCSKNQVSELSQALAELIIYLEMLNESRSGDVKDTLVYNALLRVEKELNKTSSWEIYGTGNDGPEFNLSNFEVNLMEQHISQYIVDLLSKDGSQVFFFPLSELYATDVIVKWRILQKIAELRLLPGETIYKQKLRENLKSRLEHEVCCWLKTELDDLDFTGTSTILKTTEGFTRSLKAVVNQVTTCMDIIASETLFEDAGCDYMVVVAQTLDEELYPVCKRVMEAMDLYQQRHKSFHINMRDSCALSHALYLQLKKLTDLLIANNQPGSRLKLEDYTTIFARFFLNLLQVIKMECHFRIKRAVESELKDNVHTKEQILSSSVIVLNCICTVIDEWKRLDIEDEEQKVAFLVKITDIVCDGAKIFAESLENRLLATITPRKDVDTLKKVCVLANSVEHVRQYLQELPRQMQWSEVLDNANSDPSENDSMKQQVMRILNLVHLSMDTQLKDITSTLLKAAVEGAYSSIEKSVVSWTQSLQTYDKMLAYLNDLLETLSESLKEELFPLFLALLWSNLIANVEKLFQEGQTPEYARTLKDNVEHLKEFLCCMNMKELDEHRPLYERLLDALDLNSKSTTQLQLDYYSQIAESIISPVEYLGHIAFQAGYKSVEPEVVDLYVNIQKGQRLPARKFEMSELHVKVELCPNTLFPTQVPYKCSAISEEFDNPIFNSFCQFSRLPSSVLNVKGAVIQVLLLNQDYSYSAEAVLLLNQVQNMSGLASLEFLPVYLMPLRKFDMSHIAYQVLEGRSRWDKNAKVFINKRVKVSKISKSLLPCIPGKRKMCGFSRND